MCHVTLQRVRHSANQAIRLHHRATRVKTRTPNVIQPIRPNPFSFACAARQRGAVDRARRESSMLRDSRTLESKDTRRVRCPSKYLPTTKGVQKFALARPLFFTKADDT